VIAPYLLLKKRRPHKRGAFGLARNGRLVSNVPAATVNHASPFKRSMVLDS